MTDPRLLDAARFARSVEPLLGTLPDRYRTRPHLAAWARRIAESLNAEPRD